MPEPSTSDTRRPSPRPRANATATSTPIAWPSGPVQMITIEPGDDLRQLKAFRAGVAGILGVGSDDHDEIRRELERRIAEHGATHLAVTGALDTIEHLPCVGLCPGREVDAPDEWCSFCTAKQVLADALAATGTATVHVVQQDGELLHATWNADAARRWAADSEHDGLTLTTLDVE